MDVALEELLGEIDANLAASLRITAIWMLVDHPRAAGFWIRWDMRCVRRRFEIHVLREVGEFLELPRVRLAYYGPAFHRAVFLRAGDDIFHAGPAKLPARGKVLSRRGS